VYQPTPAPLQPQPAAPQPAAPAPNITINPTQTTTVKQSKAPPKEATPPTAPAATPKYDDGDSVPDSEDSKDSEQ
jgi:hypothetical protein